MTRASVKMDATSQKPQRCAPVCGVSSLVAPFLGLGVGFLIALSMSGDAGLAAAWVCLVVLCLFSVVGLIFAAGGLGRSERYPVLPWVGLILNSVPIFYYVLFVK